MFDVTERVRASLYLLDSDNVNSLTSPPLHCYLFLFPEVDEKLMELMCKCEELHDMSNKEYSDSVWELLTQYCAGDKIEKNEMGWACGAYG